MNLIQSTILTSLPAGQKKTPSGWISFNAPCCVHNGESQDKKKRGGIMNSADGTVSYHCFNCGYKASYIVGRKLTQRMRTFMGYIGVPDDTIKKLAIEAMRHEEGDVKYEKKKFVNFVPKKMPKNTHSLDVWLEKYLAKDLTEPQYKKIDNLLSYLKERGIDPTWYDFMYSPDFYFNFDQRVIVPFYWKGKSVGYTGRLFVNAPKIKYVPDRDQPGEKLINQAIEFGWGVAFPEWHDKITDTADAVCKYGRLYTIQSIIKSVETNKLKIDLKRKMYG